MAGWIASALAMRGMSSMGGPGPPASFLSLWVPMSAAMMLPALVPAASLAAQVGRSAAAFVGGYFGVWTVSGLVAFEAARGLARSGDWLAAGAVGAAAAYQLTPLKRACLRRCRSPLGQLLRHNALGAGLEHGLLCLGCCWALMLALLALGVDSMLWSAAVATAVLIEKTTSFGLRAVRPVALALAGAALWVVL